MEKFHWIEERVAAVFEHTVANRRVIHANPELSKKEIKTQQFVIDQLKSYGVEDINIMASTGVVAYIYGQMPGNQCVALRADMDALPIQEESNHEYASTHDGVMHACGHDAHTAILLSSAKVLAAEKARFGGVVMLIFQPSEEEYPGGAITMLNEGLFEKHIPDTMFALHCDPQLSCGEIGMKPGSYMASTDEIFLQVKGKGGHGAIPEKCIDPILISSHIITSLQSIVSRNSAPIVPTVLTFGRIEGLGRTNIIPDIVTMEGIVRTFDDDWRKEVHQRVKEMATSIAKGFGGECTVFIDNGYPSLYNDPSLTKDAINYASDFLGEKSVILLKERMTAEDFAYYAQRVPSLFFRLGTASSDGSKSAMLHTSTFDIDEQALHVGVKSMLHFAMWALQK